MVMADSTETNLIAHELAHQWWGNMITCKEWGHIWLNEAFATYMSAAYNEYRFGRNKYEQNIKAYYEVYEKIKAKGADKPLVFKEWINPTADDRNLVYFKGAYVLHLLREELGEENFWKGIHSYSRLYYGKGVLTKDFQQAMENSSKKDLSQFFDKWVYDK
jgi:aminopeptidase N